MCKIRTYLISICLFIFSVSTGTALSQSTIWIISLPSDKDNLLKIGWTPVPQVTLYIIYLDDKIVFQSSESIATFPVFGEMEGSNICVIGLKHDKEISHNCVRIDKISEDNYIMNPIPVKKGSKIEVEKLYEDPSGNWLGPFPTARPLEKGNLELHFGFLRGLLFQYAFSDRVISEINYLVLFALTGISVNVLHSDSFDLVLQGGIGIPLGIESNIQTRPFLKTGIINSWGNKRKCFNLVGMGLFSLDLEDRIVVGSLGFDNQIFRKGKFMSALIIGNFNDSNNNDFLIGIIPGIKLFGETWSFDLGFFIGGGTDNEGFEFIPLPIPLPNISVKF